MLFNVVKSKEGVKVEDVELTLGEMCNVVKNTYGDETGGFVGGQVFKYLGLVSEQGSFDATKMSEDHLVIITYWRSFEQHERSHADHVFKDKFDQLAAFCDETYEIGYEMLWQGVPE